MLNASATAFSTKALLEFTRPPASNNITHCDVVLVRETDVDE